MAAQLDTILRLRLIALREAANTPTIDSTSELSRDIPVARDSVEEAVPTNLKDTNQALRDRT